MTKKNNEICIIPRPLRLLLLRNAYYLQNYSCSHNSEKVKLSTAMSSKFDINFECVANLASIETSIVNNETARQSVNPSEYPFNH